MIEQYISNLAYDDCFQFPISQNLTPLPEIQEASKVFDKILVEMFTTARVLYQVCIGLTQIK